MSKSLTPRLVLAVSLSLTALTAFSSCTKKESNVSSGNKNQVLHLGNGTEPAGLDPHIVTGVPEHNILAALFEGLVGENPKDLSPVPGAAESWEVHRKGKLYLFKIRKDAKWSNGDPLTAKDFVYSWKRMLTPELGAEYAYMLFDVKNARAFNEGKIKDFSNVGVRATDDHTLRVELENPVPYFLSLLQHYSTWPVHEATIEKFGGIAKRDSEWTRAANMVSNGPFQLKKWELNQVIEVAKSPNYWDASTVRLNGIHFYPTDQIQTEERRFRAGDLHVTYQVPPNKIDVYQKENPELIRIDPYLGTYYYMLNVTRKPFDKKAVRQAISMAIDRESIVRYVTKGGQIAAYAFTPPGTGGYRSEAKVEYNPDKAREILANAGHPGGEGLPAIELLYNSSELHKVIAESVQQMLKKELGLDVQLTNQDWKVYLNTRKNLQYGMARAAWIGDYVDPNTFLDMFLTGGGNNSTGWSNRQYDNLISMAAKTSDQEERFRQFQKAEAILLDELPVIPVYTYTSVYLIRPEVKGWHPTILNHHPYKHVHLSAEDGAQAVAKN